MKTIAILDNEPGSAESMEGILHRHGFAIFRVSTAEEARAIFSRPEITVDLLIAGLPLPGNTTAKELYDSCPDTPMLLLSESPLEQWSETEFLHFKSLPNRMDFLRKPLTAGAFVSKVNALLYSSSYTAGRKVFEAAAALRTG